FQTEQNINEMLSELRNTYTRATEKQKNGLTKISSSDPVIPEDLMSALNLDASLFGANLGVGYISVIQILSGLKQSLSQKILQKDDILGELRRGGKAFRLHTITQHSASGYEPASLETSIKGIAISEGKGCIFPVIVQLEDRPKSVTTVTRTSYSPYWGAIYKDDAEIVTDAAPYTFTDYGEKDVYLRIMARQAYDWLVSQDENNKIKGKRLRIGFHEVFSSKSGDSASAAMAIAGFSAMNRKPIRQDVAITGSIRADGAIKAVGGVANKVTGAMNSPGIEIICIPQENIADLSTFSFEQLEKITIVAANNVKTYLKYCVFDEDSKVINSMLSNLHEAQYYLMTGEKDKAYSLLKSITANYPEVYSAQRLLELLERFGKGKEVRVQRWGEPL
ncbi:MAG: hypothetical protein NTY53_14555, partial [Kiritimatiellaeota bacterium]|nr:hypothetical protein [Kiritimatiellota bacterium]